MQKPKNKKLFKRVIVIVLLLSFITEGNNPSYAFLPASGKDDHQTNAAHHESQLFRSAVLRFPQELGTIEASEILDPHRSVIVIQDAHAIADAQKSIYKITDYLSRQHGIKLFGLEGASGKLDTVFLKSFPDGKKVARIFEDYLHSGELSGAAAGAVLNQTKGNYYGVENQKLYEEGIDLFLQALEESSKRQEQSDELQKKIQIAKKESFSPELLELDAQIQNLEAQSHVAEALQFFAAKQSEEKIDLTDYPHVAAIFKQLDPKTQNIETKTKLVAFTEKLRRKILETSRITEINKQLQNYHTEHLTSAQYADFLVKIAREYGIEAPEEIEAWSEIAQSLDRIRGSVLLEELHGLTQELKRRFYKTDAARNLDKIQNRAKLLQNLIGMKLSRKEWETLKSEKFTEPNPQDLSKEILSMWTELSQTAFVRFYQNAEIREEAMYQNLAREMKQSKVSAGALIAGGFHAQGILELLKKENISYILISPAIQTVEKDNRYLSYMRGEVSWKSYFKVENGRVNLAAAFNRAVRDKLLQDISRTDFKNWRDEIIRRSAAEQNLAEAGNRTRFLDEVSRQTKPEDQEALKKQWLMKVETFIQGLENLKKENRYDAAHLYQLLGQKSLLSSSQIPQATAVPFTAAAVPAAWFSAAPSGRSEVRSAAFKSEGELLDELLQNWAEIREKGFLAFDMQRTLAGRKEKATERMLALLEWLLKEKIRIVINSGNTEEEVMSQVAAPLKAVLIAKGQEGLLQNLTIYSNSGTLKTTFDAKGGKQTHIDYQTRMQLSPDIEQPIVHALQELAAQKFFTENNPAGFARLEEMYLKDEKKSDGKLKFDLPWKDTGTYQPSIVDEKLPVRVSGPYIQRRGFVPGGYATKIGVTRFLPETRPYVIDQIKKNIRLRLGVMGLSELNIGLGGESTVDIVSVDANKALALVDYVQAERAAGRPVDLNLVYFGGDELTQQVHGEVTGEAHSGNDAIVLTYSYPTAEFANIKGIAVTPTDPQGFAPEIGNRLYYVGGEHQGLEAFLGKLQTAVEAVLPSSARRSEARSETRFDKSVDYAALKGLEHVKNTTVISLQMEMGYSAGFLRAVEKKFGKKIADQVSQATLTGGLGALMHDLFPSWKANGLDIIGVHPIWEEIKKKPYPEGPLNLGQYQRKIMEEQMAARGETPVEYMVDLPWDDDYKHFAEGNEKAKAAYGKTLHFRALKEYTSQYDAPNYHLDAYYLKDEKMPDTEDNRQRVFDTVYSDDHPAWRDYHMAVYARGAEKLIQILKQKGVVKENTVEIHNEVFVSMPKAESDPLRTLVHINHSAYQPTIYSPSVKSYGLLGFSSWMKPYIVKDGQAISIVDFAALNYDLLTGVAIDEHFGVLRRNIFRNAGTRLDHYNDGRIRSTNGVLTEHWQSLPLQSLIEHYRVEMGLPEKIDSLDFYEALKQQSALRETFIQKQEFIKASDAANFLFWMADVQKQPAWLEKALQESGKTRKDFEDFRAQAAEAAISNDSAVWQALGQQHSTLKDLLLSRPMSSNVRRQVPYKGPEKWRELLEGLRQSPEKLRKFKAGKIRQIIGGRTFSPDADNDFQAMKRLVAELGLQDHFAFIEDYNVYDANIMFQAMAGVVMLSDEFLEASATSMMKGVVNGAALIGVWGGAMPELFKIIDENGQAVDIFKKKTPHDTVIRNLKNKKWKLANGYLVGYTRESSLQAGGGRRPDAEALLNSLFWLDEQYADPVKRRELLWESVSGTSRVDMREGQARAHMQLIERTLREKERVSKDVFGQLHVNLSDAEKILNPEAPRFVWHKNENQIFREGSASPPGLFGLVDIFREISAYGSRENRGLPAVEAVRHHALHGDIFAFILNELGNLSGEFSPFVREIKKLSEEALALSDSLRKIKNDPVMEDEYAQGLERLTNLNILAIERIEQLGLWMAEQAFQRYLNEKNPQNIALLNQNLFSNIFLRKYLVRYLERYPEAFPLDTEDVLLRSFGVMHENRPFIFPVNVGSPVIFGIGGAQNKARGEILFTSKWKRFAGEFIPGYEDLVSQHQRAVFQVVNEKNNEEYGFYDFANSRSAISLGVPEPEGVQLLALERHEGLLMNLLVVNKGQGAEGQMFADFLTELQSKAVKIETGQPHAEPMGDMKTVKKIDQATLDQMLAPIAGISAETARTRFGRYLPTMMAMIAGLSPSHLDNLKEWSPFVFASLKKVQAENAELFNRGVVTFHRTSRQTSAVFSRSIDGGGAGQNIVFALQFSEGPVNRNDGKVWTRVLELGYEDYPLQLVPTHEYEVRNLLNNFTYSKISRGSELMEGWNVGIPVEDGFDRAEKIRHGWGVDIYQIRPVTPRFDLVEQTAAPLSANADAAVPDLIFAANFLDVGAEYDNESATVQTFNGLGKFQDLIRSVRNSGVGTVYMVGLYQNGEISEKLHQVDHTGIHFIGDTAVGLPRVLVAVNGYETKQKGKLRDNQGNPFSPMSIQEIHRKLSSKKTDRGIEPGTSQMSESLLREAILKLNEQGMRAITDFIFWRAPESVNETNYKTYFYRELTEEEREDWEQFSNDEEKHKFMKQLVRDGRYFAVRINENGKERLILVKYMFGEPGRDQSIRNPFHPLIIEQSKRDLETLIDRGFSGVRIDLAHRLLNSELKTMFDAWKSEGLKLPDGADYRAGYEPLKDLIEYAKRYAAEKDRKFYVIAEAYNQAHHDALRELGVDAVYYENLHKDYIRLANGDTQIKARNLAGAMAHAAQNRDLFIFPSNYDVMPLKGARGSREAFLLGLVILARLGVPVMIDAREMMDQRGQLIPIPGRDHPFPTDEEIQRRRDFEHFKWQLEQSPFLDSMRRFLDLIDGRKLLSFNVLDNQNQDQFITLDLEFNIASRPDVKSDHLLVILNMKPYNDQVIWSSWPHEAKAGSVVDIATQEMFKYENGRIEGIVFPSNIQYRMLASTTSDLNYPTQPEARSEVRKPQSTPSVSRDTVLKTAAAVITTLTAGVFLPAETAENFVKIPTAKIFPVLREEAQKPENIRAYAESVTSGSAADIFSTQHPLYEQDLKIAVQKLAAQTGINAEKYLQANPNGNLHYQAVFSMKGKSAQDRDYLQSYLEAIHQTVQAMRVKYPRAKIQTDILLLRDTSQKEEAAWKNFYQKAVHLGVAKILDLTDEGFTRELSQFLNKNIGALVYGMTPQDLALRFDLVSRVVESQIAFSSAVPVMIKVTNGLANVQLTKAEELKEETLRLVPVGALIWSSRGFVITPDALNFIYQNYLAVAASA